MKEKKLTFYIVYCDDYKPEFFTSEKEAAREVDEYIDYVYDQLSERYEDERACAHEVFEQNRSTPNRSWVGVLNLHIHAGYFVQKVFDSPSDLIES